METVEQVWAAIDDHATILGSERVSLERSAGRILREKATARENLPVCNYSSMDGYAVAEGDRRAEYIISGEVRPGNPPPPVPERGEALRIFTGTVLPDGVAVIMQEDCERDGDRLRIANRRDGSFIRRRGSHVSRGAHLAGEGSRITPEVVAVLAWIGMAEPLVAKVPRVSHITTGSEIVPPGKTPAPGEVRDVNGPLTGAMLHSSGAVLRARRHVDESLAALGSALEEMDAAGTDLFLISGGASVGDYDSTSKALREAGFTIHCSKVNSRPGKPMIFASRGRQSAFGLPGNPMSHYVCFHLFVRRALCRMGGMAPPGWVAARLETAAPLKANPRETFWPGRLFQQGPIRAVTPLPWRDSGDLSGLARANALIRIPGNTSPPDSGEEVSVLECSPVV